MQKLDAASLSKNTVKRRIADMSNDVLQKIVHQVKKYPLYSIQLDESTDIAGLPQLFVFIRYINNATISEDFLFCKALKLYTKGEDIFQCLNSFFSEYSIPYGIIMVEFAPMAQQHVLASDRGQRNESKKRHQMLNGPIVFYTETPLQQKNYLQNHTKY